MNQSGRGITDPRLSDSRYLIQKSLLKTISEEKKGKRSCRICLCEEHENKDKTDPIISACQCKGSSGNIHLKCLQEWLN
jgi:hypothetical protein